MLVVGAACNRGGGAGSSPEAPLTIRLTSAAFVEGQAIPREFTCDGDDRSPPLVWQNLPASTREVALTVEDPDAPRGIFVHWVVWGLAPSARLETGRAPEGAREGRNGFGRRGYSGPCPPRGDKHRYVFTLFALRHALNLPSAASGADLKKAAAKASVLAEGRLVGFYQRPAP